MHIADVATGNLGANGIVGGGHPDRRRRRPRLPAAGARPGGGRFFGDGAANEGAFHEAVNLAAIWKLPVVFVCENNQYGMSLLHREVLRASRTSPSAALGYGIPGVTVDGNDVAGRARGRDRRRRAGPPRRGPDPRRVDDLPLEGPQQVRQEPLPHPGGDRGVARPRPDHPLRDRGARARRARPRPRSTRSAARSPRRSAPRSARPTPPPTPAPTTSSPPSSRRPERAAHDEHTDQPRTSPAEAGTERLITYSEAVREALGEEMAATTACSSSARTSASTAARSASPATCYDRFGAERVRDTPISELGIVGAAVGAALAGMRPVVEILFFDFTCQAMDQIVNQAAKIRFMLGGARRGAAGAARPARLGHRGRRPALAEPRGLVRARARASRSSCPSTAVRRQGPAARGDRRPQPGDLLRAQAALPHLRPRARGRRSASRWARPPYAAAGATSPSWPPASWSRAALEAAERLAADGIDVSVIDPRTLSPLDDAPILEDVSRTGRALLVQEAPGHVGFTAEIASRHRRVAGDLPAARADPPAQRPRHPDPLRAAARVVGRPPGRRHRRRRPLADEGLLTHGTHPHPDAQDVDDDDRGRGGRPGWPRSATRSTSATSSAR